MWLLSFYRFYFSLAIGLSIAFFLHYSWWIAACVTVSTRLFWLAIEKGINRHLVDRLFKEHAYAFKQEMGPYGIRLINKAEKDSFLKRSLAEVFVGNEAKLRKTVEQLEMMDTLFRAGLRPDGDTWQLHDLKLKYGKVRLERMEKTHRISSRNNTEEQGDLERVKMDHAALNIEK